ncbi:MAG: flagellar hook-length control protein FliK [Clostridiales bacterium]|jgi:flagellar hook-length control protein FliK|nr:flagellar hook-length control protein FliK [Clostridiales bacterium]
MTLTNLYMQNVQAKPATALSIESAQTKSTGDSFNNYFSRAEDSANTTANGKVKPNEGYRQDRGNQLNKDRMNEAAPEQKTDKADQPDRTEKPDAVKKPDKTETAPKTEETTTEEFSEEDYDAASREIIEKLAAALGLPVEQIQQMLITLNVKPLELSDTTVMNEFVQKIVGADSAAELLTLPNVKETFAAVESVMAEYEAIARDFIQKIENEEIGRPKFIDAGRETMPILVSEEAADNAAAMTEAPMTEGQGDAAETMKAVEVKTTTTAAPAQKGEAQTAGQSFGQSQGETPETLLATETDETVSAVNPAMAFDADMPIELEKINLKTIAMKNINTEDVINQITEQIKVEVKGQATEIKVSLRPEHLGDVTLKIMTQNGIVTAQIVAENQRVKEIIEAGFNNLKDALQQKGINISQLSVSVGQENAEKQMGFFQQQQGMRQDRSPRRIRQIVDNIVMEPTPDLAGNYLKGSDLYDMQVDYKA